MTASPKKAKIFIVDDHPIFCLGMSELINKAPDLVVCGYEDTAVKARKAIAALEPDLVIVDISLKESDGLDLAKELTQQVEGLPILIVSMYDETLYAERALMAGARGYIMKQEAISVVVPAIRKILQGEIYASQKIRENVFQRLVSPAGQNRRPGQEHRSPLDGLTNRELEVFRLIGEGLATKEIAEQMHLSVKTIGTYRENIKDKLNLKHYTELVKVAVLWSQKTQK